MLYGKGEPNCMLTPFNELVTAEPTWAELTTAVDIRVIGLLN